MKPESNNYIELERQMTHYQDLLPVEVRENGDPFVRIDPTVIPNGYIPVLEDMKGITGEDILVRKSVLEKLIQAQQMLKRDYPNYTLYVTYGYRSLEIQTQYFLEQLQKIDTYYPNPLDLYEEAQRFIAVPTVAGHPTGGAIDIVIKDEKTGEAIDFGSEQYDFSTKDSYVFTNQISGAAMNNRLLLRNTLLGCGFAPYDGEWWHFEYGDREWAYYYNQPFALYNQVASKDLSQFMVK